MYIQFAVLFHDTSCIFLNNYVFTLLITYFCDEINS